MNPISLLAKLYPKKIESLKTIDTGLDTILILNSLTGYSFNTLESLRSSEPIHTARIEALCAILLPFVESEAEFSLFVNFYGLNLISACKSINSYRFLWKNLEDPSFIAKGPSERYHILREQAKAHSIPFG